MELSSQVVTSGLEAGSGSLISIGISDPTLDLRVDVRTKAQLGEDVHILPVLHTVTHLLEDKAGNPDFGS